jgi:hypothetical protein
MSRYDDDRSVMDDAFGPEGEWGSPGAASGSVAGFIDDLRGLADVEAPEPSAELAALLSGDAPLPRRPVTRRLKHRRVVGVVAASVLVGGTGVAAADGRLPQPAQRFVSDVVNNLTPFTVPAEPDEPVPSPVDTPTPGSSRAREHHHPVVPAPGRSEDGADDGSGAGSAGEPSESSTGGARDDGGGAAVREAEPSRAAAGGAERGGGSEREGGGGRSGGAVRQSGED